MEAINSKLNKDELIEKYVNDPTFIIESTCAKVYPCKHIVINSSGKHMLSALTIRKILLRKGIENKHFDYCDEIIRRKEHPTEEEFKQDIIKKEQIEISIKKQNDIIFKQTELGKACGSQKRLDKLKNNLIK